MTRIGAVSYLNTKPLIHGLRDALPEGDTLSLNLPSRLAEQLDHGELDVALIPSVEYFRGLARHTTSDHYQIISDAVIACRGPVWSVRLVSRVPVSEIRTLALDEGSRTSAALVRVLLWQLHKIRPQTTILPIEQPPEAADADAVLIIGDRAMRPETGLYEEIWDLGDRWCRHTELPFVFAMWIARPGVDVNYLVPILESCRDRGLEASETIARQYAASHGLTTEDLYRYFAENLHFTLGPKERAGLASFRQGCEELGLISDGRTVG
ncbi:menaquinone biosynthetic enzyme MqnA/MqnD family protein [Roseiconus lacunae]|uniref:Chorismate dehydratase n=1 Tax=Roseiconus lacunae TaxID=2605694 RepID=A0ABT7PL18_9BACT|nr:menaquinone biosynthesis protein [Roseiconus lacunae]MCD0460809.1 menaquinone biosynthesis protein [Roseiconus lacunae]MDM4017163.1 menaquinone biosynthesis protein [Roseiconus lacunae]WRQ51260.1 menaquinone biosynthesis protein [Stieleria sp. HD01]